MDPNVCRAPQALRRRQRSPVNCLALAGQGEYGLAAKSEDGKGTEYMPFAGQSAGLIHEVLPVREIIRQLISQAEETLRRAPTLVATIGVGRDAG